MLGKTNHSPQTKLENYKTKILITIILNIRVYDKFPFFDKSITFMGKQ
jgi:hypothetical protein